MLRFQKNIRSQIINAKQGGFKKYRPIQVCCLCTSVKLAGPILFKFADTLYFRQCKIVYYRYTNISFKNLISFRKKYEFYLKHLTLQFLTSRDIISKFQCKVKTRCHESDRNHFRGPKQNEGGVFEPLFFLKFPNLNRLTNFYEFCTNVCTRETKCQILFAI